MHLPPPEFKHYILPFIETTLLFFLRALTIFVSIPKHYSLSLLIFARYVMKSYFLFLFLLLSFDVVFARFIHVVACVTSLFISMAV